MRHCLVCGLVAGSLVASAWGHEHAAVAPKTDFAQMWQMRQAQAPRLAVDAAFDERGRLWLARVVGQHLQVSHSDDAGGHFSPPLTVNPVAELISADGEARPRLAVVADTVHVSWTQALPQPFAGHVRYAVSHDGGKSFSVPQTVNDDRQPITHRFNAMLADAKGVTLAWIDKRDGVGRTDYRGAAIYSARRENDATEFSNRKLADHSCECCRLAMAPDLDGTPLVLWRHVFGRNVRDFALARLGEPLQRVSNDGWEIDACPHHGGALTVDVRGGKHLAWFTGAPHAPGLYYRRLDGEQASSPQAFGNLDAQAGHPALAVDGDSVWRVWREFDGEKNRIMGQYSKSRGDTWSPVREMAAVSGASDDPLLLRGRGAIWLVWNTAANGLTVVRLQP